MASRKSHKLFGWTLLAALGLCAAAVAQGPWGGGAAGGNAGAGNRQGGWGAAGGQGMGPGMGMPGMGMPGMPPGGGAAPAIAVTADSVYVVIGSRILRLDPKTLAVLAQKDLPMPTPQMPGMPGQPGMPQVQPQMQPQGQ